VQELADDPRCIPNTPCYVLKI